MYMGFFMQLWKMILRVDTHVQFFLGGCQCNKNWVRDFYEICTNMNLKIFKFILIVSLVDWVDICIESRLILNSIIWGMELKWRWGGGFMSV